MVNKEREANKFVFIGGIEGSGTSHLLTLLSEPSNCASLGGNYLKIPNRSETELLAKAFTDANARIWDREASFEEYEIAMKGWKIAADNILSSQYFNGINRFIFKRSFPFGLPRGRYVPDLKDWVDMFPDTHIIIISRDPCAATYSGFRRGFDSDLRRLAVIYCEQLTWLAGQVHAIGPDYIKIISYHQLWENPLAVLEPLAKFCGIPFEPVRKAALSRKMESDPDIQFLRDLPPSDLKSLRKYFNDRRQKQWDILFNA
jgi:hypothetical protein